MALFDFLAGDVNAPKRAAAVQAKAAEDAAKQSEKSADKNVSSSKRTTDRAIAELSDSEALGLKYRQQAGEALTLGEQQALAQYDASSAQAIGALETGQAGAFGALDAGQTQGLNALSSGTGSARTELQGGFDRASGYLEPYASTGTKANQELADLQGLNGPEAQAAARSRFQTDPGYAFRVQEGVNALDRSATARGGIYSGAAMKALNDYGQGQAAQEYGNYWNRTANLAQSGQQASGDLANLAQQLGVNLAELESRYGQNAAQIIMDMAKQKGGLWADTAARIAGTLSDAGARSAGTISDAGTARANLLTGTGQFSYGAGQDVANTVLGSTRDQAGYRTTGTTQANDANIGGANALAGGIVGKANMQQQGISNALALGGAALSAATQPIKSTSLIGRYL